MVKLEQLDITKNLLHLFSSYLTGRNLHVVMNGRISASFPVEASVLQGSVLRTNFVEHDILQSIPAATAYTDDYTLSWSYPKEEVQDVIASVNKLLGDIIAWGESWQVKFAPDKTKAMVISHSQENAIQVHEKLKFGRDTIPLQDSINILGLEVDC